MNRDVFTFEDFQQMEVIRTRGVAELIVDHFVSTPGDGFEADHGKPVRLIGFEAVEVPEGWKDPLRWDIRLEVIAALLWLIPMGIALFLLIRSHVQTGREIERARSKMFQNDIEADRDTDQRGMHVR